MSRRKFTIEQSEALSRISLEEIEKDMLVRMNEAEERQRIVYEHLNLKENDSEHT